MDSGYLSKGEPSGFAGGLDVECEGESSVHDDSKVLLWAAGMKDLTHLETRKVTEGAGLKGPIRGSLWNL